MDVVPSLWHFYRRFLDAEGVVFVVFGVVFPAIGVFLLVDFALDVAEHLLLQRCHAFVKVERCAMRSGECLKVHGLPLDEALGLLDVGEGVAGKMGRSVRASREEFTLFALEHVVIRSVLLLRFVA